jgi:mRNA interferase MazF/mRNA interferase ChpB
VTYIPDRGDIVWLQFDPSAGREIMKTRPALVLSRKVFNLQVKLAIVVPITSTIRGIAMEVVLPTSLQTQGAVLAYQIQTVDYESREARLIEHIPEKVVDKVVEIARVLIQ